MKEGQNRIVWIDWAKVFAIWFVVLGHDLSFDENVASYLCYFRMPLFFLCSGCLFNPEISFEVLLRKSYQRLFIPYVVYNILWALFFIGMGTLKVVLGMDPQWDIRVGSHILPFVLGFSQEQFCAPVWFLLSLIWCKFLGYGMWHGKKVVKLLLGVLWISLIVLKIFTGWRFPFSVDTALFGGVWFVIGMYAKDYIVKLKDWIGKLLIPIGFIVGYLVFLRKGGCAYVVCEVQGFEGLFGTFCCLLAMVALCLYLERFRNRIIEDISEATLFIMGVHVAVLSFTSLFLPKQGILLPMLVDIFVLITLTWLKIVLSKTPLFQRTILRYCI